MLVTDVEDSNLKTVYVGDKFGMLMTDFSIKKSRQHTVVTNITDLTFYLKFLSFKML